MYTKIFFTANIPQILKTFQNFNLSHAYSTANLWGIAIRNIVFVFTVKI